ncbi:hypothetical protein NX862_12295 [Rhodobacter sp. KR11]|nr:hypothetical protein [Rhodobacter sp. KR11]
MMWLVIVGAVLAGVLYARKKGGRGLDMAQYGAVWGIAATLVSVLVTIIVTRMAG